MADLPSKSSPEFTSETLSHLNDVLQAIAPEGIEAKALPPVHLWNPVACSDIGMEIRADGSWWHEGSRFKRMKLVKLFSRILRVDPDGETYLVTPYEKVIVHVEDAPFIAVRVDRAGDPSRDQSLVFTTNLDEHVIADSAHPISVHTDPETGEPSPYIHVRSKLMAKLSRPVFYELADMSEPAPDVPGDLGVWSQGQFFRLGPAE